MLKKLEVKRPQIRKIGTLIKSMMLLMCVDSGYELDGERVSFHPCFKFFMKVKE